MGLHQTYGTLSLSDRGMIFLMASLVTSYPDGHGIKCIGDILADEVFTKALSKTGEHAANLSLALKHLVEDKAFTEQVQGDYVAIFDQSKLLNPLYETEYGRDRTFVKGNTLADIAGFYQAFGLLQNNETIAREMPDHVAVEFEFYSYMIFKEVSVTSLGDNKGIEIVRSGRTSFLTDHLGRFVQAIAARPGVAENEFYKTVFGWCSDLVSSECEVMSTAPAQVEFYGEAAAYEGISCGGGAAKMNQDSSVL